VAAWERVQFGELTIVPRRRVPWGPLEPADARNIFLQSALVDGDWDLEAPFIRHNRALRARIEAMEAKRRERGLMVDGEARFAFFDARVPPEVHSLPSFERWRRRAEARDSRVLFMTESDLLAGEPDADLAARFPDALPIGGGASAELRYELAPGSAGDGVHARVALADLGSAAAERLEWLVPGLLAEKIEALIRTLPKQLRVRLFPLREVAEGAAEAIPFGQGSMLDAVAAHLSRVAGIALTAADFDRAQLPPHLRLHVEVVSDDGDVLAAGDDLATLRRTLAPRAAERRRDLADRAFGARWQREGMRSFDIDLLPQRVEGEAGGRTVVAYPMLIDRGATVALALAGDPESAERSTRLALRRLHAIAARAAIRHHLEYAPGFEALTMTWLASTGLGREALLDALTVIVAGRAFVDDRPLPRTPAEFEATADAGAPALAPCAQEAVRAAQQLHARSVEVLEAIDGPVPSAWQSSVDDIRRQRVRLAAPDALARVAWSDVPNLVRFMAALGLRARKLRTAGPARDAASMAEVARWEDELARAEASLAAEGGDPGVLAPFRALVEEYRVSLFAQELRTPVPVSAERLERAWRERRRG
jgi:ATP-dependent helicase HrpA